jgi:hypothetical protein
MTTFYDGNILSASQLNDLVMRVNALEEGAIGVNLGFAEITLTRTNQNAYYQVTHKYNWLHLRFAEGNNKTNLRVYYGNTLVYSSPGNGGEYAVNVNLSSFGLSVGTLYRVRARWGEEDSSGTTLTLRYMVESDREL